MLCHEFLECCSIEQMDGSLWVHCQHLFRFYFRMYWAHITNITLVGDTNELPLHQCMSIYCCCANMRQAAERQKLQ